MGDSRKIEELAQQYRALRRKKGHFSGGQWNDDLDNWGGRLHAIMSKLGNMLGRSPFAKQDIVRVMGQPDATVSNGQTEQLVYFWRGRHDTLSFICCAGAVQEAKWYYALE